MKKVLLVGVLSDLIRSLDECLSDDFQVQLCSEQFENIQGMMKIIKPDLVVLCEIGIDEFDVEILEWFKENYSQIPVLLITTTKDWGKYREYCVGDQFDKLFRPVSKKDLVDKCYYMLKMNDSEYIMWALSQKKKVMVVDDSSIVLRNIKSILEEDYTVYLANSGEQALKMIPQKQPDLVLLDYEMPGMNGKMTFEAMLEDEYAKDIPVVFLTSIDGRKKIYDVLKSYPAGYILKPPDKKKLLSAIRDVLRGKKVDMI